MLSKTTNLETIRIVETWTTAELERFAITMDIPLQSQHNGLNLSKSMKANQILIALNDNQITGPYSGDLQKDAIKYVFDKFESERDSTTSSSLRYDPFSLTDLVEEDSDNENMDELFNEAYTSLSMNLKRDGFKINNGIVVSLLPEELLVMRISS